MEEGGGVEGERKAASVCPGYGEPQEQMYRKIAI